MLPLPKGQVPRRPAAVDLRRMCCRPSRPQRRPGCMCRVPGRQVPTSSGCARVPELPQRQVQPTHQADRVPAVPDRHVHRCCDPNFLHRLREWPIPALHWQGHVHGLHHLYWWQLPHRLRRILCWRLQRMPGGQVQDLHPRLEHRLHGLRLGRLRTCRSCHRVPPVCHWPVRAHGPHPLLQLPDRQVCECSASRRVRRLHPGLPRPNRGPRCLRRVPHGQVPAPVWHSRVPELPERQVQPAHGADVLPALRCGNVLPEPDPYRVHCL